MKSIEINASKREALGKKATKNLRKEGKVPCVLYGGEENIHFTAHSSEFRHLIYTPYVYLVNLNIDGKSYATVLQDIQFHPVSDEILHIDFLQIFEDKKIAIEIPVELEGFAKGVREGGKLQLMKRKLKVKSLPKDLPDVLAVNVDNVGLGQSVKVSQLHFENLEMLDPKNSIIATVKLTRAAKGAASVEEGETPAQEKSEE